MILYKCKILAPYMYTVQVDQLCYEQLLIVPLRGFLCTEYFIISHENLSLFLLIHVLPYMYSQTHAHNELKDSPSNPMRPSPPTNQLARRLVRHAVVQSCGLCLSSRVLCQHRTLNSVQVHTAKINVI